MAEPSTKDILSHDKKLVSMALLVGLGVVLHRIEALLPLPSPWIKLGLANLMPILALVFWGIREALVVTLLRVCLGSVLGGTFLGPTFFLSLVGGIAATLVMGLVYQKGPGFFSMIGLCVAGAYTHTFAVMISVYFVFVQPGTFLNLLPLFLFFALLSGILTGTIANALIQQLGRQGISLG